MSVSVSVLVSVLSFSGVSSGVSSVSGVPSSETVPLLLGTKFSILDEIPELISSCGSIISWTVPLVMVILVPFSISYSPSFNSVVSSSEILNIIAFWVKVPEIISFSSFKYTLSIRVTTCSKGSGFSTSAESVVVATSCSIGSSGGV